MLDLVAGILHKNWMKLGRVYEFDEFRKDVKGDNDPMWFSANQTFVTDCFFFANFETCHKKEPLSGRATHVFRVTLSPLSFLLHVQAGRNYVSVGLGLTISCYFSGSRFLALGLVEMCVIIIYTMFGSLQNPTAHRKCQLRIT